MVGTASRADVVIIGSGVGGGSVAHRLAATGASILILERGGRLPREDRNWDPEAVYAGSCYKADETWRDGAGESIHPGQFYYVGGNSKVFGTAMFRFRRHDFEEMEHDGGVSPAWPVSYDELEPYYGEAETLFGVHGAAGADPTEPRRSTPYPFAPLEHNQVIGDLAGRFEAMGLHPFPLPSSMQAHEGGACVRCNTCDGFPCKVGGKGDAETCLVDPALSNANVSLRTDTLVERLLTDGAGGRVVAAEVRTADGIERVEGGLFVLSAGAVNSAALLLRSDGLANGSDMVGRNFMNHNCSAIMAFHPLRANEAENDFYFGDGDGGKPLGNLQLLGKIMEPMLRDAMAWAPRQARTWLARHSVDWYAMSEDLPDPESRIRLDTDGSIVLDWKRTNIAAHSKLVARARRLLKDAGFPIVLAKAFSKAVPSHQCGTVRFGEDPATAPLDPYCRAWEHENLYVVDAGFFPSSAALNPALTICAQALRAADHMVREHLA